MNVLITGGTGYIGTELVRELYNDDSIENIIIYDNLSRKNHNFFIGLDKFKNKKVSFVQGDILDSRKLKFHLESIDTVYHLAAKVTTPFANHDAHNFDQVNNWGTSELTYLIENSNVKTFVYASSTSVYGASNEALDVMSSLQPKTYYSISKMKGEAHVRRLQDSNIATYILRLGNVYGYSKSMRLDSVINKFMFEANFMNKVRIQGTGNQKRSFIHVNRLTASLKKFATDKIPSGTYNLVENSFTINEIVDTLKEIYPELEMLYVNQDMHMRSLHVAKEDTSLLGSAINSSALLEDLKDFKDRFVY